MVQGDIATCAGSYLHLWSINGDELTSINTVTSRNQHINCVTMSTLSEWDSRNVLVTGSSDGVVRVGHMVTLLFECSLNVCYI